MVIDYDHATIKRGAKQLPKATQHESNSGQITLTAADLPLPDAKTYLIDVEDLSLQSQNLTGTAYVGSLTSLQSLPIMGIQYFFPVVRSIMNQSPNTKTKKAKHAYEKPQAVVLSIQSTESGTGSVVEMMAVGGNINRKTFGAMNASS